MTTTPAPTDHDLDAIEAYLCRPSHSVDRLHGHATQLLDALATERRQGAAMASITGEAIRQLGEERDAARQELAKTRAELKRAEQRARTASQHARRCDAQVADADAEVARLQSWLADERAKWLRHQAEDHPVDAEANPATTAEPAANNSAPHCGLCGSEDCPGKPGTGCTPGPYETYEPADEPKATCGCPVERKTAVITRHSYECTQTQAAQRLAAALEDEWPDPVTPDPAAEAARIDLPAAG